MFRAQVILGSSRILAGFISPDSGSQGFETVVAGRDPVVAGLAHYVRSLAEAAVADMEKAPGPSKLAWNEPSLEELLTIRGSYAQKSWPVRAYKEFVHGHGEVTFVHISKKEEWLVTCVCGKAGDRAALKRSKFLATIQQKAKYMCMGHKSRDAAVAADNHKEYDPMELLDNVGLAVTPKKEWAATYHYEIRIKLE